MCWMWSTSGVSCRSKPSGEVCGLGADFGGRARIDDVALITHSLGSRATMDALQRIATRAADEEIGEDPDALRLLDTLQESELQLFMLSNQLPLLEAGQDPKEITGRVADFCTAGRAPSR